MNGPLQHDPGQYRSRGFTLVEILIVVVILGVLAATVIAQVSGMSVEASRSAFAQQIRILRDASHAYRVKHGDWPQDSSSGQLSEGLFEFVKASSFQSETPIGGVWDIENNDSGVGFAVGVHFNGTGTTRDEEFMITIDEMIDDGNLETGSFREIAANRYYDVIEE